MRIKSLILALLMCGCAGINPQKSSVNWREFSDTSGQIEELGLEMRNLKNPQKHDLIGFARNKMGKNYEETGKIYVYDFVGDEPMGILMQNLDHYLDVDIKSGDDLRLLKNAKRAKFFFINDSLIQVIEYSANVGICNAYINSNVTAKVANNFYFDTRETAEMSLNLNKNGAKIAQISGKNAKFKEATKRSANKIGEILVNLCFYDLNR